MTKNFISWEKTIQEAISKNNQKTNWKRLVKIHYHQIAYLQHERLAHLLVMLFMGLYLLISLLFTIFVTNIFLFTIDILLLVLFIPYLFYYRSLENSIQKWYRLADEINHNHLGGNFCVVLIVYSLVTILFGLTGVLQ